MNHQEDEQQRPPGPSPRGALPVLLMCVCVGAALLHPNLSPRFWSTNHEGPGFERWYVGWPVVYGVGYPPNPEIYTQFHWAYVDMLAGIALVLSPAVAFRLRRFGYMRSTQFTLSGLFLLSTAVAMVFALSAMERAYGWARLTGPVEPGTYSALSALPWYYQVPISLGIVCTLYVALVALCRAFRAVIVKLRGMRRNEL